MVAVRFYVRGPKGDGRATRAVVGREHLDGSRWRWRWRHCRHWPVDVVRVRFKREVDGLRRCYCAAPRQVRGEVARVGVCPGAYTTAEAFRNSSGWDFDAADGTVCSFAGRKLVVAGIPAVVAAVFRVGGRNFDRSAGTVGRRVNLKNVVVLSMLGVLMWQEVRGWGGLWEKVCAFGRTRDDTAWVGGVLGRKCARSDARDTQLGT